MTHRRLCQLVVRHQLVVRQRMGRWIACFAVWLCPGVVAWAGDPVMRVEIAEPIPAVSFLSWDTEGGDRVQRNLLAVASP